MRWNKKKSRRNQYDGSAEINVTPLIDVALTLLIVFMVTTPMIKKEKGLHVQLPKGDIQEVPKTTQKEIIICIDAKGTLSINGQVLSLEKLLEKLHFLVGKQQDKTVFIEADKGVTYGIVIELVETIKKIEGIGYVALPTASTL